MGNWNVRWLAAIAALACGCSGEDDPPAQITVNTVEPPQVLAVREGDGQWRLVDATTGTTAIEVHGPYAVAVVCMYASDGSIALYEVMRTPDDDREIDRSCEPDPAWGHITGEMVQAGTVVAGTADSSTAPNWTYDVLAPVGTGDIVAATADKLVIRRGLTVGAATALDPPLDVDAEGTSAVPTPVTITNLAPGETAATATRIETPAVMHSNVFRGPPAEARIAPDALLDASDLQSMTVYATAGTARRSVIRSGVTSATPTAYTFLDPLGPITFARTAAGVTASWLDLPPSDGIYFTLDGMCIDGLRSCYHYTEASPAYVLATGAKSAEIETSLPWLRPEWRIDLTTQYRRYFAVSAIDAADVTTSSVTETLN